MLQETLGLSKVFLTIYSFFNEHLQSRQMPFYIRESCSSRAFLFMCGSTFNSLLAYFIRGSVFHARECISFLTPLKQLFVIYLLER